MQFIESLYAEPFGVDPLIEAFNSIGELSMLFFIFGVHRTAVAFHALLLKFEMHVRILLKKLRNRIK